MMNSSRRSIWSMLCWRRARLPSRRFLLLMRTLKSLFPILAVAALLAGCGGGGSAKLDSGDIAVVGSSHITQGQFERLMSEAKTSYAQQGRTFPNQGTTDYETVKGQAVLLLVQQSERESKAKSMGIDITDKDVSTRLTQIKKQYFGG